MSLDLHALADAALELDPADRLALASLLIDSVEDPADADWIRSWTDELDRRSAAADERSVRGSPWSEVRARLMKRVRPPPSRLVPFERSSEELAIEPARGSLAEFPWPEPVPGADDIDVVATVRAERADRSWSGTSTRR